MRSHSTLTSVLPLGKLVHCRRWQIARVTDPLHLFMTLQSNSAAVFPGRHEPARAGLRLLAPAASRACSSTGAMDCRSTLVSCRHRQGRVSGLHEWRSCDSEAAHEKQLHVGRVQLILRLDSISIPGL